MEKAVLNVKKLNVTQGMNGSYSHQGDLAIDMGDACEYLKAPFTGVVKRIYTNCNAIWLESVDKVRYADGTEDYMTVMTLHDNDVSNLKVGQIIKQGTNYYQPGIKGKVTGSHIHISICKGKFTGTGWYQNKYGAWCSNNQYDITKALYLHNDVQIMNAMYNWIKTSNYTYTSANNIGIGSKVKIGLMNGAKKWIADDVQVKYGIYQIRENVNAGGTNAFDWKDNGIPEACVDLVDSNGNKRADSDRVHCKKGDKFVFAKTFTVKQIANDNGKTYYLLDYDGNANHRFWVVGTYLKLV